MQNENLPKKQRAEADNLDNDDRQIGRILSRREVLALFGAASVSMLVGCGPAQSGSATATSAAAPTLNAEAQTAVAMAGDPTAMAEQATAVATAESANTVAAPACVVRPELTEGPYYVDEQLERSDVRSDPTTGEVKEGALLLLTFNVSQVSSSGCTPLAGASWMCGTVTRWGSIRTCPIPASTQPGRSSCAAIR